MRETGIKGSHLGSATGNKNRAETCVQGQNHSKPSLRVRSDRAMSAEKGSLLITVTDIAGEVRSFHPFRSPFE